MLPFFSRRRRERETAERIYAAIVDAARRPGLYRDIGVPDTIDGRFEMMSLHFHPFVQRLINRLDGDAALAQRVKEIFVAEMDATFRDLGVGDLKVPRRMRTFYQSFAGRLTAYAAAAREGEAALAAAVRRNVFPESNDRGAAVVLARYLMDAAVRFEAAPLEDLRAARLPYPQLPETSAREI